MKLWIFLSGTLIFYFVYGFYLSQFNPNVIPSTLKSKEEAILNDYNGVINVHSNLSTGSSAPSTIVGAAKNVGLDFLVFTDLNNYQYPSDLAKYHGHTLVMTGSKNSYLDSRIILLNEKNMLPAGPLGEVQTQLSDLFTQKVSSNPSSLSILAHPFLAGFSWSGDIPPGLDGMEILNIKSLSARAWSQSKLSVIWSLLMYPFNPELSFLRLMSEPSDELEFFDQISKNRKFVAYSGAEANARAIPIANYLIKFPSYAKSFSLFTNHALLKSELTGNSIKDNEKIFRALKSGEFYMANELLGDPTGFSANLLDGNKSFLMGSVRPLNKNMKLQIHLPGKIKYFYEICIYKDGQKISSVNEPDVDFPISEPGTYRVQVRVATPLPLPDGIKWISWIYTNPFFISQPPN